MLRNPKVNLVIIVYPYTGISKEESAIGEMVASRKLYGLTKEEIAIVEGKG